MVVHQVVSETTPYQIQKKFYILGKFLLRKSYEDHFGLHHGRVVRMLPNWRASKSIFKFRRSETEESIAKSSVGVRFRQQI